MIWSGTVDCNAHCYRPQRSCGKVMFLHLSVSHSVYRGCLPHWMLGYTPPPAGTPLDRYIPWADTHPGRYIPPAGTPLPITVTAADGTHPTGMLSCDKYVHRSASSDDKLHNKYWCNILKRHHFPVHKKSASLCTPLSCVIHHLACTVQPREPYKNEESVYICTCVGSEILC